MFIGLLVSFILYLSFESTVGHGMTLGSYNSFSIILLVVLIPVLLPIITNHAFAKWTTIILGSLATLFNILMGAIYFIDERMQFQAQWALVIVIISFIAGGIGVYYSFTWIKDQY
jgi:hypothetical protein